ncbi:MAG: hypothetical protein VYB54_01910 [Pseudomonadota bacterium]|nr:hypothetical protein [Pseudomonadota bacterium]
MDDVLRNALKRQKQLEAELLEIKVFVKMYQRFSGTEPDQVGDEPSVGDTIDVHSTGEFERSAPYYRLPYAGTRSVRNPTRDDVRRMAREFMLERGEPMARGQLVDVFAEAGWPISGSDPARNMGTIMWRLRDDFVNIDGHGYWPRDVPLERVGYDPSDPNSPEAIARDMDIRPTDDD